MLTGKELGEAIRIAVEKKTDAGVKRKDIAEHFHIRQPSLNDWINKGSIHKKRLPELWRYFSDVVDMEHWGMSPKDFECFGLIRQPHAAQDVAEYRSPRTEHLKRLIEALEPISEAGIDHLADYARFIANKYPRA